MKSYIYTIGTATPSHRFTQKDIGKFMASVHNMNGEESHKLDVLYRATGIQYRNSVLKDFGRIGEDLEFLGNNGSGHPGVTQRMKLFKTEALPLSVQAIKNCLGNTYDPSDFTHLITVSCTGMYAPGLDIELIGEIGLPTNIQRTGIHFMGCYAAFNALKVADAICKSNSKALVLIVCVELCTIHFQNKKDEETLLSNAIFADGAAATIVGSDPRQGALEMMSFYNDIEPAGKQDMTWEIADFGFEIRLSSYVPDLIRNGMKTLTDKLLQHLEESIEDIDYFAIHPGGKKILRVVENCLDIANDKSRHAHEVLSENGNMSSPTILFVLKKIMEQAQGSEANILAFAFGPGLTLESMMLKSTV